MFLGPCNRNLFNILRDFYDLDCCYFRNNPALLTDKDCESVYELVYSSHRGVAQAAGEFLNVKLFTREPDEATKALKTKKGKKRSENTPYIRDLVQFFIESEVYLNIIIIIIIIKNIFFDNKFLYKKYSQNKYVAICGGNRL